MELVAEVGIVTGLLESLKDTLQFVEEVASPFALQKLGSNFKEAITALNSFRSQLVTAQTYSRLAEGQSRYDGLPAVLEDVEVHLNTLRNSIQQLQTLRSKLFTRSQGRILLRRDIDVAKSSIGLALVMVEMIRGVQGRTQYAKLPTEVSG